MDCKKKKENSFTLITLLLILLSLGSVFAVEKCRQLLQESQQDPETKMSQEVFI
jgi:CHASE3 domain sensor protein